MGRRCGRVNAFCLCPRIGLARPGRRRRTANLAQVALPLNGQAGFRVLLYALLGQDNLYPELSLTPYLNAQGQQAVTEMVSDMCVLELLQDFQGVSLADVTDINPLTGPRLQRIAENELGKGTQSVPVYQYHEEQDGLVAFSQARDLKNLYCSKGVNVQWQPVDTQGSSGVVRHINLVTGETAGSICSSMRCCRDRRRYPIATGVEAARFWGCEIMASQYNGGLFSQPSRSMDAQHHLDATGLLCPEPVSDAPQQGSRHGPGRTPGSPRHRPLHRARYPCSANSRSHPGETAG